jgi:hypothetical protein
VRRTEVDVAEAAATNFAANSVLVADTEVLSRSVSSLAEHVQAVSGSTTSGVFAYHCRHGCEGVDLAEAGRWMI